MRQVKVGLICIYPLVLVAIFQLLCKSCQDAITGTSALNPEAHVKTTIKPSISDGLSELNDIESQYRAVESREEKRKSAHDHCLVAHNKYRAMHGAPPMKTDPEVGDFLILEHQSKHSYKFKIKIYLTNSFMINPLIFNSR